MPSPIPPSAARRRYAGVLVDIFYDHLLASDWPALHGSPLADFAPAVYRQVAARHADLPADSHPALRLMAEQDWFASYTSPDGIAEVLARMSRQARQPNPLAGGEAELLRDREDFREDFMQWLAAAQQFNAAWDGQARSQEARG